MTSRKNDGFTLVEVSIAAVLTVAVLGLGISAISKGRDASRSTVSLIDVDDRAREILQRLSNEIRSCSLQAEDTNDNNALDTGEDTNANGRFEDDWSVTGTSVTFNVRKKDGTFTLPITYKLVGGELKKIVMLNAAGRKSETTLMRGVTKFALTPRNRGLGIDLDVQVKDPKGKLVTRSRSVTITRRN